MYAVGQTVRVALDFYAPDDGLTDLSAIEVRVRKPNGVIVEYAYPAEIDRVSAGRYEVRVPTDLPGRWLVEGSGQGSGDWVDSRPVTRTYFDVGPEAF